MQIIKWVENTKMFFVITFEVSLFKRLSYEKVLLKSSAASSFQNGKFLSDNIRQSCHKSLYEITASSRLGITEKVNFFQH